MLTHFFKQYDKLFYQYVYGKCIALVGPAQSIIGTGKGEIIDQFDLVVRLNKSLPLPDNLTKDIGSKTNIVYNSLNTSDYPGQNNLNPRLYKKANVSFMCSSYPFNNSIFKDDIASYVYKYKFELPFKVMDDTKFNKFERLIGTRPYTGTCAIMDLLSYPIKYLYITGLDFYQTKYYSEYRAISKGELKSARNGTIHQAKPQLDYLKNISLFDNRILLDSFLDKMLYYDYYKVIKQLQSFNINEIFGYGDEYFKKYFELKLSNVTFTRTSFSTNKNNNNNNEALLTFTDNTEFCKNNNEYCIFITANKDKLNSLNKNMEQKKFIANFFYNENKYSPASIFLNGKFLGHLKNVLSKINIMNCNINLAILLSIMLYLPNKHYFSQNEVLNSWNINMNEKKFVLFLLKKKILELV